jgi:hypothetical protein
MKTAPRKAAADRKGLTQTMPERIRNTRDIFRNQIDKMMTAFKKPSPEFYGGYFAARVIGNRATSQAAPPPPPPPASPATPPTPAPAA